MRTMDRLWWLACWMAVVFNLVLVVTGNSAFPWLSLGVVVLAAGVLLYARYLRRHR